MKKKINTKLPQYWLSVWEYFYLWAGYVFIAAFLLTGIPWQAKAVLIGLAVLRSYFYFKKQPLVTHMMSNPEKLTAALPYLPTESYDHRSKGLSKFQLNHSYVWQPIREDIELRMEGIKEMLDLHESLTALLDKNKD